MSKKFWNHWRLSTKVSCCIAAILIAIFIAFITIAVIFAQNAIQAATFGELEAVTSDTGSQIESILKTAENTTIGMVAYIQEILVQGKSTADLENKDNAINDALDGVEDPAGQALIQKKVDDLQTQFDKMNTSDVYPDIVLSQSNKDAEDYLLKTAKNTVENNADIVSVGVMFEPYAFSPKKESYTFFVSRDGSGQSVVDTLGDYAEYSQENFYTIAITNKKIAITEPYYDKITNANMVTIVNPIMVNSELKGIITADVAIDNFSKVAIKNSRYPSIYNVIINNSDTLIYHSTNPEKVGLNNSSTFYDAANAKIASDEMLKGQAFTTRCLNADKVAVYKFFSPISACGTTWWSDCIVEVSDLNESAKNAAIILIVVAIGALALLVFLTAIILKRQLNPINNVVQAAKDIASGNLSISLPVKNMDEIGELSLSFNDTAAYLKKIIGEISSILNRIAHNDLDVSSCEEYRGEFVTIETSLHDIIDNLNGIIGGIGQTAEQVSSGSDQVSSGAQALSQGATEQASSVEELAATITEISQQVKSNADNASNASAKASKVGQEMEESNKQMQQMISAMDEISGSASEIGKIIKTIEDIAFQTNILALNAAVEAARAGAAGKGFAVVADEVRNLASKSAEASKSTSDLIERSIKSVEHGTMIADATARSMLGAVQGAREVAEVVDRISEASNVQAQSINQVTQGVEQISAVVQTNSATAEESAAASEELSGQAQMLKELVSRFKLHHTSQIGSPQDQAALPAPIEERY